jgi:large subunit ribosomal protein L35
MKTHRGAAKRFRRRKSGTIRRGKARRTHILTKKSPKRKMNLRSPGAVHEADVNRVERMLNN